jgi:hypothetical protein
VRKGDIVTTQHVMEAQDPQVTASRGPRLRRIAASIADLVLAMSVTMAGTAAAGIAVTVLLVRDSGQSPIGVLANLGPGAMAFWAFELLFFTPIGLIAANTTLMLCVVCWLCRSGALGVRSPGMALVGIQRPSKG